MKKDLKKDLIAMEFGTSYPGAYNPLDSPPGGVLLLQLLAAERLAGGFRGGGRRQFAGLFHARLAGGKGTATKQGDVGGANA